MNPAEGERSVTMEPPIEAALRVDLAVPFQIRNLFLHAL
jgi:hypothetical protein